MSTPLPAGPSGIDTEIFFEAAREGRLLLRRSRLTGKAHWYPRPFCPDDGSETEWFEASGDAEIFSFTVVAGSEPYVVAYVTLAEGPRMLTAIVDCEPQALHVGQRLSLTWRETTNEGQPMPCFTPQS